MEKETNMQESSGVGVSTDMAATVDSHTAEGRRGPGWKGWALSILAAIALSVTATLLLGGSVAFRSDRTVTTEAGGYGAGRSCCPPTVAGK